MAKLIEYDVTGVEESTGGTGVKIRPGVHPARIVRCTRRETKKDGSPANDIEVALDVGSEFDWVFTYIGLNPESDWKLAEFIRAVGLKDKGKIDPEKLEGKIIRVKINPGSYEGDYSPNAGRLMPAQDGDEDLIGQSVSETSSRGADGPDAEEPEGKTYSSPDFKPYREGEPDPEDPEVIVGSYEDWEETDLLAEAEDRELTLPAGRASKKNKAIQALRDEDAEVAGGGGSEPPDAEEETAAADADDYDTFDIEQLKEEWKNREMGDLPSIRGSNAEKRMMAAIIEAFRKDDAENPFSA